MTIQENLQAHEFIGKVEAFDDDAGSNKIINYYFSQVFFLKYNKNKKIGNDTMKDKEPKRKNNYKSVKNNKKKNDGENSKQLKSSVAKDNKQAINNTNTNNRRGRNKFDKPKLDDKETIFKHKIKSPPKNPFNVTALFQLDPRSGKIYSKRSFDREERGLYTFNVVAQDQGNPKRMADEVEVVVKVLDVNDEMPVFDKARLSVYFAIHTP